MNNSTTKKNTYKHTLKSVTNSPGQFVYFLRTNWLQGTTDRISSE
jgi:hypothetical protein